MKLYKSVRKKREGDRKEENEWEKKEKSVREKKRD